jgi:uncharacterized membrane protein YqjE
MVRSETPGPAGGDPSLGDLVALAAKDISQLIRYEIDLAKTELKGDAQRVGTAVVMVGMAGFVGCLVLVMLSWAWGYGLITLGIWTWAAFLIVAATWAVVGVIALGIAYLRIKHLSGLRETRKTVSEGIELLRPEMPPPDGQRPEITARETR